jgi:hypothetical protein
MLVAIGCTATCLISRYLHARYGKYVLAVMFTLIIAADIYGRYSSRDSGFGYCDKAQSADRHLTDYATGDNYLFFVILFIQFTLYSGIVVFSLFWQQDFWMHVFLVNSILNVAYYISDTIIIDAAVTDRAQDIVYTGSCFLFFLILTISRRNFQLKARRLRQKDAEIYEKQLENLDPQLRFDLVSFIYHGFQQFCDVTESKRDAPLSFFKIR